MLRAVILVVKKLWGSCCEFLLACPAYALRNMMHTGQGRVCSMRNQPLTCDPLQSQAALMKVRRDIEVNGGMVLSVKGVLELL